MKNARVKASPERRIQIIGQIDDDNTRTFFECLNALENESSAPIEIELLSEGGYAVNALAIVGRMRQSKCDFVVSGYAQIASAAVVILAAGDYRRLSAESYVQVHEDHGKVKGNVSEMERYIKQVRAAENAWNLTMAKLTGVTADTWADLHNKDTFLTPQQCLIYHLIDEVI